MGFRQPPQGIVRSVALVLALVTAVGCGAIKKAALNSVASELAASGTVFTRDNDPELVRDAIPFALKLYESLLESVPKNKDLLIATCSAFTQYSYGFVETDAEALGEARHDEVVQLKARALRLYIRGKDYCLRAMDVRWKGISAELLRDPAKALSRATAKDVPLLYWTAASWGAAASLGLDQPELVIDLPVVRALAERALALDETWSKGAMHELMISIDSLPEALGGSPARAREHFEKAVKMQQGLSPAPYVSLATGVLVPAQDRAGIRESAQGCPGDRPAKDPENQLVILIGQRRAKALLDQHRRKVFEELKE